MAVAFQHTTTACLRLCTDGLRLAYCQASAQPSRCKVHSCSRTYAGICVISRQVLAVYEGLYPLLEVGAAHRELELNQQLAHQQLVAELLASLHYPHNCSIDLRRQRLRALIQIGTNILKACLAHM